MGLSWNEPRIHCSKVCWVTTTTCHSDAIPASHCCSHNRPHHIDSKLSLECSNTWLGSRHCWLHCNRSHPHLGRWASFHCFHKPLCGKIPGPPPNPLDEIVASICCKSARRYTALSHSHPLRFASISWHLLRDLLKGVPAKRASMVEHVQRWLVSRMNIFTCFLMSSLEWLVTPLSGLWILHAPGLSFDLMFISRTGAMQHIFSIWLPCNATLCIGSTSTPRSPFTSSACPGTVLNIVPKCQPDQTKAQPQRHEAFWPTTGCLSSHSGKSHSMRMESFLLVPVMHTYAKKNRTKEYANDVSSNCSPRLEDVPMPYGIDTSRKI